MSSIHPPLPPPRVPLVSDGAPIVLDGWPLLYEDDEEGDMGEAIQHTDADQIISIGIATHLRPRPQYRVVSNFDLHYHPVDPKPYVSPDVMVVEPSAPLPEVLGSYRIGVHGPGPLFITEILSKRSFQQRDLTDKPVVYSQIALAEYVLFDPTPTGQFLPRRLVLRRLQPDGTWIEEKDADGGVTSRLGFRIVIDTDHRPRIIDAATGKPYVRPDEAQTLIDAEQDRVRQEQAARLSAEERIRQLEAELARLRTPNDGSPSP